jgi:tetratricopeptide (TPR) repeat protein
VIKTAAYANRPRLVLENFEDYRWEPVQAPAQAKIVSIHAAEAHHRLAQHEEELAVLRRLWEEQPAFFGTTWVRVNEARALAALGRIDECRSVVAEAMTEPSYEPHRYGTLLVDVAGELRAHGHLDASRSMATRALDWFDRTELPAGVQTTVLEARITALTLLGRDREATGLARELLAAEPDRWQSQARVGVAAARNGDRVVALEMSGRLAELDEALTFGIPSYERAAIAAQLGDRTEAIRLLQHAVSRGFRRWGDLHIDSAFDSIRDDSEFQEIVRPKG